MESFNDIYDIESPRTSDRKMATIENSIQQSLLYNNEIIHNRYSFYNILISVIVLGIVAMIILGLILFING
jgi:hypothetical protein